MSRIQTSIVSPLAQDSGGFADYGRHSRSRMIALYKEFARLRKAEAETILNTPDDDFIVEQYVGDHVRRNLKRIDP